MENLYIERLEKRIEKWSSFRESCVQKRDRLIQMQTDSSTILEPDLLGAKLIRASNGISQLDRQLILYRRMLAQRKHISGENDESID